jgi:predicted porin
MNYKSVLSGVAIIMATTPAVAQSNTEVYGVMDVGIVSATNVGTKNGTSTAVLSSPMDTSRLGFRTRENLSGGSWSGANLEMQVQLTDGSQGLSSGTGTANTVFSRAAYVMLGNKDLGEVRLGRMLGDTYLAYNATDVRGGKNFGSSLMFWNDGSSFNGSGVNTLTGGSFISNAIRYSLPTWNGITATASYAPGGAVDDTTASSKNTYRINYKTGGVNAVVAYQNGYNSAGAMTAQSRVVGGTYAFAKYKLGAGYTRINNPSSSSANTDFTVYSTSAGYQLSQRVFVSGGYYMIKDNVTSTNGAKSYSLVADYELSKRTGLYAGWAQTNNRGTSGFSPYGAGSANRYSLAGTAAFPQIVSYGGQTQGAMVVGMTHSF